MRKFLKTYHPFLKADNLIKNAALGVFLVLPLLLSTCALMGQVRTHIKGEIPTGVSGNAITEGFIKDMPFVFSFGGISRQNLPCKNLRYNALTGKFNHLPSFPDNSSIKDAQASLAGSIIYIIGGVNNDTINPTVYRFDQNKQVFLSNGEALPKPVKHHGQATYKDSLLFIVGGENRKGPINYVQVYNSRFDHWTSASPLPELITEAEKNYVTANILNDTLSVVALLLTNNHWKAHLFSAHLHETPLNQLKWSHKQLSDTLGLHPPLTSTIVRDEIHWLNKTKKPTSSETSAADIVFNAKGEVKEINKIDNYPDQIHGIARISDTIQFLLGGLNMDGSLNKDIIMLSWTNLGLGISQKITSNRLFYLYPNPCQDQLRFQSVRSNLEAKQIEIYNMQGRKLLNTAIKGQNTRISLRAFDGRAFIVRIFDNEGNYYVDKVLKN